jgi:hypothetical protein
VALKRNGKSKSKIMQTEFWSDIGRTQDGGGISRRFLPTPTRPLGGGERSKDRAGTGNLHYQARTGMLTSSAAASPAKTSATPEKDQDLLESAADCSTKQPVSFARWDQDTCCWKTWQRSLLEDWETYSGRWPRSGMTVGGTAYKLPTLARRISGTGSSSSVWRTPNATDGTHGGPNARGSSGQLRLTAQVMWPTPDAHCYRHGDNTTANQLSSKSAQRPCGAVSGQLNPTWVEWLQGFPMGWTEVD